MDIEISTLSNGLTIITDPMPQLESAALGVWVNTGTRNETANVMGVSHMLEHMAFKGTVRRSARQIAEEMEAVGAYLNAYTSREQTAFHARALKGDVPLAIDILADILTSPTFAQNELERERQVVLQEIGQAHDTPDDIIFDHLQTVTYPNQPMGYPILGTDETVNAFTREHLMSYMSETYRSESMVLVASGAVNHAQIVNLAEEKFSHLITGKRPDAMPARYSGGDMRVIDDLEQAHVTYAFQGIANADPETYAAQVYVTALGGGMSSRLFQEVREKRGLCYSIYAFSHGFSDSGIIGVYAGTSEADAGELSAVIAGEMASLAETVSEEEVARAKAQLKSGLLMGMERPAGRAEAISGQFFTHGRVLSVQEVMEKLAEVDAAAVRRFATKIMESTKPGLAAIGPLARLESYETFAHRFGKSAVTHAAK